MPLRSNSFSWTVLQGVMVLVGFVAGAYFAWDAWHGVVEFRAAQHWPSVQGKVISFEVGSRSSSDDDWYFPVIFYEYKVKGLTYNSRNLGFGDYEFSSEAYVRQSFEDFVPGRLITVYYDPGQPENAVLDRQSINYFRTATLIFFCLISIGMSSFLISNMMPEKFRKYFTPHRVRYRTLKR